MRAAVGLLLLAGCAGDPSRRAALAQAELAQALAERDAVTLGRLLGTEPATLALAGVQDELAALGPVLAAAPIDERARAHTGRGTVLLVREAEGWRIDRGLLGAPTLATPEQALAAFAEALGRVRRSGLADALGRRARALVLNELARCERGLADPSAVAIEVARARATAVLPTGLVVELVREADEWRIDDVHE